MAVYLLPPWKQVSLFAGVSATVDSDYTDDWLCDGRPGRPVRSTDTGLSATVTPLASGTVSMAVLAHHNVTVNATLGGDLSGTLTAATVGKDGVSLNPFVTFSPVSGVDSVTLTITGNGATVVAGEFIFGEYQSLTGPFYRDFNVTEEDYGQSVEIDLSSIPPYDRGIKGRTLSGMWPALTTADRDILVNARDSQRSLTRPCVLVPLTSVNDAWVGFITKLTYKPADSPNRWDVSITFQEVPRVRW